jgi:hypothetical protein
MSFEPPAGILDIGNATLRVGKLEVAETVGLNQGLQNIVKNDLLITETDSYTTSKSWGLKLPTTWVADFDLQGQTGKYVEFNFYNEGSTSNTQGYTLNFKDTSLTLKYDNGNTLTSATIPTIVGTFRKVNIFFERGVIAVSIDGARVLYHKESDGFNNGLGVASRVVSTTGGAFLNAFIQSDHGGNSIFKNLRIVNGRFISDKTSNVSFIGSLGVGVNSPQEALDIRGNMHFNRVSNVSQVSVDSNVVTEYTGPHDRPLRKYPEVAILSGQSGLSGGYTQDGYNVEASSEFSAIHAASNVFNHIQAYQTTDHAWLSGTNTYGLTDGLASSGTSKDTFQDVAGSWLGITLPVAIRLDHVHIYNRFDNANSVRPPKTGIIWASNDGTSWYNIFNFDNLQDTDGTLNVLHVNNTNFYTRYRVQITAMHNDPQKTSVAVGELELYGHEEGSGSLDTTLKSVYNVPATTGTQLEVYYDGQDYSQASDFTGTGGVVDKVGGDQDGTAGTGVGFDTAYKAFVFDGTANGKIVGTHNLSGTAPVNTCSAWFKKTSSTGDYSYISRFGTNATSSQIAISIDERTSTLNKLRFEIYGGSTALESELTITENVWYHVVGVYSGGTWNTNNCKMYLNGVEISLTNGTNTTTTPSIADNTLVLGSNGGPSNWDLAGSIANFRLYSKALNADQVKELYDYQKDYFLGSKSQVTLYKGHLGVGVTEPSGQLELAGDERIQEYPPGPMDDYETLIPGHGVFCASASNDNSNSAWEAFRKTNDNGSHYQCTQVGYSDSDGSYSGSNVLSTSSGTPSGEYIILKLPYQIILKQFSIQPRNQPSSGYGLAQTPKDGQVWGSNDGNSWYHLHSYTGLTFATLTDTEYFSVNQTSAYSYYTLIVTRSGGGGAAFQGFSIGELRYFGTPGPTTLDKGSLSLTRSLDVPRISRYDVDTETPRYEKLVVDFDTTVNSSPTDISGKGNHGTLVGATYSPADKAFNFDGTDDYIDIPSVSGVGTGAWVHSKSFWFKLHSSTEPGILFLLGRNGSTRQIAVQVNGSGQFQYFIYGCNSRVQVNGSDWYPDVNRWYHCVTVFRNNETTADGSVLTGREMYIDGVKQTLVAIANQIALDLDSSEVRFGNQFNSIYLDYELSNPKLYNVALEPSEVQKLYRLGRTGRSMVISDTAVGIGKAPEAQLDVRGRINATGSISSNNPGWSYWITTVTALRTAIGGGGSGTVVNYNDASNSQNWETGSKAGPYADRTSSNFNHITGIYTAPEKGAYFVSCSWSISFKVNASNYDDSMHMKFVTTGNPGGNSATTTWESGDGYNDRGTSSSARIAFNPGYWSGYGVENAWCMSEILLLNAGSTVRMYLEGVGNEDRLQLNSLNFSGIKIA